MPQDVYRDSYERYAHDAEFCLAVNTLFHMAVTSGYTPGELRQIAFMAALKCEQYAAKSANIPLAAAEQGG